MDGREKREELAARIKAGEKSLLPMLWGECRGTVIIMAAKYRSIIEQNAFVNMEDFIQCGYFAMLEAVEAYNPEKGYKFTSYMTFKYKKQIYKMFGNVREGDKRIFPAAASSLNITLENDGHETELLEMLEDKSAGSIESDYEKKELQQIVRKAVGKLPERERYVIQEIYFNGRAKTEIADGQRYKDQSLQALHRAYFKKEPREQNIYKTSPEEAAIEGEKWDKWLENIMDEIGGFENGL